MLISGGADSSFGGVGFIIGNLVAVAAGVLFALYPVTSRLARGLNVAIFALPPIAIADILPGDAVITRGTQDYALGKV